MIGRIALLVLLAGGCTRSGGESKNQPQPLTSAPPAVASAPASSTTTPAPPSATPDAAPPIWPAALPRPALAAPGPIKAIGFPTDVTTCLPDPAEHAGFTKDGAELGYCMHGMNTRCELVDRAGKTRTMSSAKEGDSPASDPAKEKEIAAFVKESGLPALAKGDCVLHPPKLTGTWAYPDVVVNVVSVASSFKNERLVSQPLVRLGGAVGGEPPVLPITYAPPRLPMPRGQIPFNTTELNALALSPDGTELGVVVHTYCGEWCDHFQVVRMPVGRFASLVYNDTGFKALKAGQLDRAAELFLRAAYVDETRELPAYNLACVYARLGDARAEPALALAVARGGDPVRARAPLDADLASVRTAPWFVKLTSR
jgi:hypothetical protein